jgi:hypothetical protein
VEGIELTAGFFVNIRDDRFEGRAHSIALAGVGVKGGDDDAGV